jgi:hypothetical protein
MGASLDVTVAVAAVVVAVAVVVVVVTTGSEGLSADLSAVVMIKMDRKRRKEAAEWERAAAMALNKR